MHSSLRRASGSRAAVRDSRLEEPEGLQKGLVPRFPRLWLLQSLGDDQLPQRLISKFDTLVPDLGMKYSRRGSFAAASGA